MEMANRKLVIFVIVAIMVFWVEGSKGLRLCHMSEDGLMACKPSMTNPNPVDPSTDCCEALSGADLSCFCSYKNSALLSSLGIDPNLAMALPAKCNLTPSSNCLGV